MTDFLKLLLSLSLSGALAAFVLLALRGVFKSTLSGRWRYYAWIIVFARLLLPVSPPVSPVGVMFSANLPESLFSSPSLAGTPSAMPAKGLQTQGTAALPGAVEQAAVIPTPASALPQDFSVPGALALLWGGVALVLLTQRVVSYRSFTQYLRAGSCPVSDPARLDIYAAACERAGVRSPPELLVSPLSGTPMLVGICGAYIVLPECVAPGELTSVLLHELLHHRRRDALYKWAAQCVLCLHWFNPAVWLAARAMERDCELSCDEAVLRLLSPQEYRSYGDALLHAVKSPSLYRAKTARLALGEDAKKLKERLSIIMNYKKQSSAQKVFAACLALAFCLGTLSLGAYAAAPATSAVPVTSAAPAPPASLAPSVTPAEPKSPQGVLELAMQSIKQLDIDALCRLSNNKKSRNNTLYSSSERFNLKKERQEPVLFGGSSEEQKKINEECVRSLSWKTGSSSVTSDTATVELTVTNRDFGGVIAEIVSRALNTAALGGEDDEYDRDTDKMYNLMKAVPESKTVAITVSAQMYKENGVWRLRINDAFANAVCGNLLDGDKSEESKKKIADAESRLNKFMQEKMEAAMADMEDMDADLSQRLNERLNDMGDRMEAFGEKMAEKYSY